MPNYQVHLISTAAVIADGQVILVKYKDMPDQQGGWFIPNDMLKELEHPADAVKRIVREQVGFEIESPVLKDIESFRGRDKTWHLSFHHLCKLPRKFDLKSSSDLAAAQWFALDKLPLRSEFAHHGWSLDAISKVTKSL